MKVLSIITLDELTDVLENLVENDDLEFEYEVNENTDNGHISIQCKMFDSEFSITPLGAGPFYEDLLLTAYFGACLDPILLCNDFNTRHSFASASPFTLESEEGIDEEDTEIIEVEKLVILQGGVTDEHIEATIRLWSGMLILAEELFEGTPAESE